MEVYYKDLISKEGSLDALVDDLAMVVQGVDDFAAVAGESIPSDELHPRLERLKESCRKIRQQIVAGSVATDQAMRRNPYSTAGLAFGAGLLLGVLLCRSRHKD